MSMQKYSLEKVIGKGGYGTVSLATYINNDSKKRQVAIKVSVMKETFLFNRHSKRKLTLVCTLSRHAKWQCGQLFIAHHW